MKSTTAAQRWAIQLADDYRARQAANETADLPAEATPTPTPAKLPDVPLDALPAPLGDYGKAVSVNMEAPLPLVFAAMLATASTCVPTGARILGRPGHVEIGPLWLAPLAMPGSKKSPTISRVTSPLNDYDGGLQSAFAVAHESWRADCAALQAQSKRGAKPVLPPEPRRVQALADDATVESLADVLAANEPTDLGLLCAPDELAAFTGGMNQYKSGKGSDRAAYLKLWAGQPVRVNRRGRFVYVKRPRMALIAGIQPAVACKLQAFDESDGLLDRFHWIDCRDESAPRFDVPPVPPALEHAWNMALRALLPVVTPGDLRPKIDGDAPPADVDARLFVLAPDAVAVYGLFYESCDRRDLPPLLRGYGGKLAGQCLRVALTLHHLKHGADVFNRPQIDGETMRGAIAVTQWLAAHTYHVRTFMAGGVTAGNDARRVLAWIAEQGGYVTLRDLTRTGPPCARNAERAAETLAELARDGHGDFDESRTPAGRDRRGFRLTDRA
ncbi:MAG: DUF3987 domain-containing protein [Planctomycetes bacterium]|nr:DUF3987 domain-containing protein [Planctomycetota bacterium]